jgi:hypothetical protein
LSKTWGDAVTLVRIENSAVKTELKSLFEDDKVIIELIVKSQAAIGGVL